MRTATYQTSTADISRLLIGEIQECRNSHTGIFEDRSCHAIRPKTRRQAYDMLKVKWLDKRSLQWP